MAEDTEQPVAPSSADNESNQEAANDADKKPESTTTEGDEKEGEEGEDVPPKRQPLELKHPQSTLKASKLDNRFATRQTPVTIMFLTGPFKGQMLDMGAGVSDYSESRSSNWEQLGESAGVMNGMNFTTVNPHEFSLSLDYYDTTHDVMQLVRCNEHLQSLVDSELSSPPRLQLTVGKSSIKNVVCVSSSITADPESALPAGEGFRHATVQLQFKLLAGKNTVYELAPALGPNPLDDYRNSKTQEELQREGYAKVAEELLSDCLDADGSAQVADLIRERNLNEPDKLKRLSPRAYVNLVASGAVNIQGNEQLEQKLKNDLALVMAESEQGVTAVNARRLSESIRTGSPDSLEPDDPMLRITDGQSLSQYETLQSDYNTSYDLLRNGEVGTIDGVENPTLRNRANSAYGCGLFLRESGFSAIAAQGEGEKETLDAINDMIAANLSDEQLKEALNLPTNTPESVIRNIRNAHPYTTKAQFVNDLSGNRQQFTGHSLWGNFNNRQKTTLDTLNGYISSAEDVASLAESMNISEELAQQVRAKKEFASREELLDLASDALGRQQLDALWWKLSTEPPPEPSESDDEV